MKIILKIQMHIIIQKGQSIWYKGVRTPKIGNSVKNSSI